MNSDFETHSGSSDIFASSLEGEPPLVAYLKGVVIEKSKKFKVDQAVLLLVDPKTGEEKRLITAGSLGYTGMNIAVFTKLVKYDKEKHEKFLDQIKADGALVGKLIQITHTGKFKNEAGQLVNKFKIGVNRKSDLKAFLDSLKSKPADEPGSFDGGGSGHESMDDIPF